MFYSLTDVPGGRWAWEEVPRYNMKSFCDIGVKLIQVDIAFDHVWKEDNTIALDTIQRQLRSVIDICPEAAIFIRFHVNPPKWWQKKFSEENTVYADREPKPDISWGIQRIIEDDEETPPRHSLASEKWKTEATEKLIQMLSQLKHLPEANALAGIQIAGGVYGEWHYWGFIENEPDMSNPMLLYFRNWLTQKYKSNKALQSAWGNKTVTLTNAQLPTLAQRIETQEGVFRNPISERNVIDYYEAQHQVVAEDILHFCKVVKENWPRPIITGAFYGYFYSIFGREASGGHLQLQHVLNSPYIDFLSGPGAYYPSAVEMGDPYRSRSLINSITLHGKLWLDEMDQQTPLVPLKENDYQVSLEKSIAQVRRNVLFTFSKGQGLWFYDFGPAGFNGGARLKDHGTWGWWDEPTLRNDIKNLKIILEQQMSQAYKSDADVLLVHDTESFYHTGSSRKHSGVAHWANNWVPVGIFKSGVVHDAIHLDDLDKVNIDQYKVVVFVNTFVLKAKHRNEIASKVAKNNRHLVWIYAPGYSDGSKLLLSNMEDVTKIKLTRVNLNDTITIDVDTTIANSYSFSLKNAMTSPLFAVMDENSRSFGKIKNSNYSGLASKTLKESTSWFMSLPFDNNKVWRHIFKQANVHTYTDSETIIYGGSGLLSVHTKNGGPISFTLKNGKQVTYNLPPNTTWLLNNESGEVVLK